jgi:hypothetical protein
MYRGLPTPTKTIHETHVGPLNLLNLLSNEKASAFLFGEFKLVREFVAFVGGGPLREEGRLAHLSLNESFPRAGVKDRWNATIDKQR